FQQYDVQSFPFESFEDVKHCRLVVQRQRKQKGEQLDLFDGEYTYRCILTNDWDMTDEEIIQHYNKRGTAEQVFDRQNNDFGWAHLPKSFMNQNTVFLLLTAMAANFYQYIVSLPLMCLFGVEATDRVKSFLFRFIAVPAKWIRTARQNVLNVYSGKPYDLIWAYG
ncbi:MAG: transposase, partial [Lachnospiraceae bacterium]|nr:transposase [Lachnospiraceae bacterium]